MYCMARAAAGVSNAILPVCGSTMSLPCWWNMLDSTNQNMLRFGQRKSKPRRVGTPLASRLVSFSMTAGSASHVFGKSLSGSRPASFQIALLA